MQQPFSFKYTSYQVVEGDRIDNIAYQYYGDPLLWCRDRRRQPGRALLG